ncbi:iron chaperone [Nocardia sp. NPDC058666]|uniref:iron chaperone n=1 Tax=Nocardia sp. NPDC058666 TaxID=3346587 RepID=UPI003647E9E7
MVQSKAPDVATYLAELPENRREPLTRLRDLCRTELPGFTEAMSHGMPVYERNGIPEVAFASQKHYISLYLLNTTIREAFTTRLAAHDMGKGCLRFRKDPDYDLVRDLLRATASGNSADIC